MFTSTWGNQQNQQPQQQQQQHQPSAFGQSSAFGSTPSAFGSTSAFGQPQQQGQQQPQVNPMFGNISTTPSSNTASGGFGAFGGGNPSNTGVFAVKPATGFGAFSGGTSAFGGGTSAFGQPATTTNPTTNSAFSQPAATTSAFGGGGSLFGGNKFGTSTSTTGTTPPVITTGTSNPPYVVTQEKDGSTTLQFQSVSCMPAYLGYSFEELRVQDYQQNRKGPTNTGVFGQSAFGGTQPATTGLFGAQTTQQPSTSVFGAPATTTGFGTFGQAAQPTNTGTNSLFGGTSAFGQPQQQQQQQPSAFSTTSGFGQPQQQQTSAFGNTGTSAFGNTANKPAFGTFGTGAGTSAFGTGTSAFGTPQGQQQQQPAQTTGLFSTTQPSANAGSAFSAFGNTAAKPSIFGTSTTTQPSTTGFGTFGTTQQQQTQPQQNQQPSLFGNTGTGLFGQPQQQQNQQQQQGTQPNPLFGGGQTTTPSLFGNTTTGTGLFGNTQQAQQPQQQPTGQQQQTNIFGSLFNKPTQSAAGPLFGQPQNATAQPQQGSLFGNTFGQSTQTNPLFGGAKPTTNILGGSLSGSQNVPPNLFGTSTNVGGAQGMLTASITQPMSENLPIFSMLPPGPRLVDIDQSPKKKAFFLDVPTRSPVARVLGFTPANSKLRGFGSGPSLTSSTGGLNASVSFTAGKPGALILSKGDSMSSSMTPDFLGRSGSPALGSGGRHSVKKVVLEKKVEPTELFVKSGSQGGLRTGKVVFSPALTQASREKDAAITSAPPQVQASPTPVSRVHPQKSPNRFTATQEAPAAPEAQEQPKSTELQLGDYFVKPDLATLKKAGYDQLSSFEGLVVGRKGYGEIQFLEPVDLTGLPKLGALLGEVIKFDDKECSVYPESEDADKPPPGSGLNVKARISLERCWAVDKATREPITDANNASAAKHLKRLKNMKDTHFENFDIKSGTWTFTVDHF
ncbi:nucleoporin autopeptidase-domain-containing protein [Gymnopilus junonius]|uniref:Nucleoporin autopeptidase-domain-containing protein n=1 Tax=Gymnopilus junonius TaxID=109634 RepID=A0A9P5TV58_GYMJU|nr:nucleoporin autopeptidase-domain-containing protein [Gymnopilus junonius]